MQVSETFSTGVDWEEIDRVERLANGGSAMRVDLQDKENQEYARRGAAWLRKEYRRQQREEARAGASHSLPCEIAAIVGAILLVALVFGFLYLLAKGRIL